MHPPPPLPSPSHRLVLLCVFGILRTQAERKIKNEAELISVAETLTDKKNVRAVNFESMSVEEQLRCIISTDVLISIHGAALSYIPILRPGSHVLELMPGRYRTRQHFRFFAAWAGIPYFKLDIPNGKPLHEVPIGVFEEKLSVVLDAWKENSAKLQQEQGSLPAPIPPLAAAIDAVTPAMPVMSETPKSAVETPKSRGEAPKQQAETSKSSMTTPASINHEETASPKASSTPSSSVSHNYPSSKAELPDFLPEIADIQLVLGAKDQGHRLCVVVPFRDSADQTSQGGNRTQNLRMFIPYMTKWLERTGREAGKQFQILVVEMTPGVVFNKGALFNAGFNLCQRSGFDYIALHDVDQIPESVENTYSWPSNHRPIHLCSASSQFGYKMAYESMVGGALLMTMDNYKQINGDGHASSMQLAILLSLSTARECDTRMSHSHPHDCTCTPTAISLLLFSHFYFSTSFICLFFFLVWSFGAGFSNSYYGWGQEDDDVYFRIRGKLGLDRLPRSRGRCTLRPFRTLCCR